jgi:hypothetical protein
VSKSSSSFFIDKRFNSLTKDSLNFEGILKNKNYHWLSSFTFLIIGQYFTQNSVSGAEKIPNGLNSFEQMISEIILQS